MTFPPRCLGPARLSSNTVRQAKALGGHCLLAAGRWSGGAALEALAGRSASAVSGSQGFAFGLAWLTDENA